MGNIDNQSAVTAVSQSLPEEEKLWTANFIRIIFINITLFASYHMLMPTFPLYIRYLGGTDLIVGIAAGLFSAAGLISRLYTGWLLDNKSRMIPLFIGIVLMILCPIAFIIITPMIWIMVFRFIQGFGFSMGNTSSATNSSDIIPKKHFSEGLGIYGISSVISLSVSPAFGLFICERFDFRTLFFLSFLLAFISLLLTLKFKTKHHVKSEKKKFRFKDIFNPVALPASMAMFFAVTPYGAVSNFVALYALDKGFTNADHYFIFFALSAMLFRVMTGKVIDKKGANLMYYLAIPAFVLSLTILTMTNSQTMFLISGAIFGLGFGSITPLLLTKALKMIPLEKRGSANSTFYLSYDLGLGLGGLIAGALSDLIGYTHMYLSVMVFYIFSVLIYTVFLYEKKPLTAETK